MSTLAKVFVVINLVLSIVFITLAGTLFHLHTDWREAFRTMEQAHKHRVQGYEIIVESLKGEKKALQDYSRQKEEEARLKDTHLENLRKDVIGLTNDLALKRQEFQLLLDEHKKVVDQIDAKDNRIEDLTGENDRVKRERRVALDDKETAEKQVARLTRIKQDLQADLADLRKNLHESQLEREDLAGILDQLTEAGVEWRRLVTPGEPVPTIEGLVQGVDEEMGLVVLSVGEEDEVRAGYEFTVFRGDQFIGKVVVERLYPDMCGAQVRHLDPGAEIRTGDSVTTRPGF